MEAIDVLAAALDRFTAAYERRTEVERDRLSFDQRREERYHRLSTEKLEYQRQREDRLSAKAR